MHSVLSWAWYTDPRVLDVEERRLFRPSWQYVGPLECVRRPGDQMVGRLLRVPVVVVRDGDGELRGFLNVCRHRGSVVVAADGNAPRLRCPYHAWTYGLDGSLRSAPQCGPEIEAELGDLGLLPVRVATFGPFVFASAAADGPPPPGGRTCPSGRSIRTVPAGRRASSTTTSARMPTRRGSRR